MSGRVNMGEYFGLPTLGTQKKPWRHTWAEVLKPLKVLKVTFRTFQVLKKVQKGNFLYTLKGFQKTFQDFKVKLFQNFQDLLSWLWHLKNFQDFLYRKTFCTESPESSERLSGLWKLQSDQIEWLKKVLKDFRDFENYNQIIHWQRSIWLGGWTFRSNKQELRFAVHASARKCLPVPCSAVTNYSWLP